MTDRTEVAVVLDTNVLVSALIFGGHLAPLADMIESGTLRMFLTRELLEELARVLTYPKLARVLTRRGLTAENVIRPVVAQAVLIIPKPLGRIVVVADPADDAVLACAATAGVEYIVSGNRHLTDLETFYDIPIVTPMQFLTKVPQQERTP
jgi:putative PIN family toxin of toxin-antitoxin system